MERSQERQLETPVGILLEDKNILPLTFHTSSETSDSNVTLDFNLETLSPLVVNTTAELSTLQLLTPTMEPSLEKPWETLAGIHMEDKNTPPLISPGLLTTEDLEPQLDLDLELTS